MKQKAKMMSLRVVLANPQLRPSSLGIAICRVRAAWGCDTAGTFRHLNARAGKPLRLCCCQRPHWMRWQQV